MQLATITKTARHSILKEFENELERNITYGTYNNQLGNVIEMRHLLLLTLVHYLGNVIHMRHF
jgi:hypothetical protein